MRIERIVARAFGPFRGDELSLAPGMTVVAGPNEAGKSTWHAAMRLAITGLRRGKGPGTAAERQLAERHRPWDAPDSWSVEARLRLADGRIIEMSQDLAGKVDCRAVDVGLGRDVSHEILDGTPDASRWLGLNRDAFAATISVSQAQILAVTEAADELQEQMQRAAATHGTDATAAEAIARLEAFRRDAVGVDRVGARGPLRTAKDRLAAVESRLAEATRQHDEYLERSAEVDVAERRVDEARRAVTELEAQLTAARAAVARRRHAEAADLAARHPAPPEALAARDERADEVAGAIDAWRSRPSLVALDGPSVANLEAELGRLPAGPPDGDVEPHVSVRDAFRALELADDALAQLDAEPAAPEEALPDVDEGRVRDLARRLRDPQLPSAARLEQELAAARAAADGARRPQLVPLAAGAAIAALAGVALVVAGATLPAFTLLLVAAGLGVGAWRTSAAGRGAAARVARVEAALVPYREARQAAAADREAAANAAHGLGLPPDATALDDIADRLAAAAAARRAGVDRDARRRQLHERRTEAAERFAAAIRGRGADAGDDPRTAWEAYGRACRERAEIAAAAGRRAALQREIAARRVAERSATAAVEAAAAAERRLRAAAAGVDVDATLEPDAIVAGLRTWQRERGDALRRNEAAIGEWERLRSLLDGTDLDELAARAAKLEAQAAAAAAALGRAVEPSDLPIAEVEARLAARAEALQAEKSAHDALRGNLEARRDALPDVAEAEESVVAARGELARVVALADTLDRTLALLRSAEERVHRSLAPVLASTIGRWLPAVCQGAYTDVTVDPANLAVRVKEAATGTWREARLLSEGTREQIYLLLRVAMAEHLVTNGEVAPLLLDEVTVQSDMRRKHELLDVLHRLSADRQVVLFTHDDDVLGWAARRLDGERDATVLLPARHTPTVVTPQGPTALPIGNPAPAPAPTPASAD